MKQQIFLFLSFFMFIFFAGIHTNAQSKQNLKVLYVGGSGNYMDSYGENYYKNEEEKQKDIAGRMSSFEKMLSRYFTKVTVVKAADYKQPMSNDYDVTVMDGKPAAVTEKEAVKDDTGRIVNYIPAAYFTEDFDKPVLLIGELGEPLGRSIGLKIDWYCLCLDAHALNFDRKHPIFNGPFPVKMTIEELPTPEEAFHYEYFLGHKTPVTIPMWRVQTKGYKTDPGFRIGLVARPWGFEDSPDAESISSGVCQKTLDAVAIGRHGNYFHWGFAASPEYMTPESQTVLANAVSYISKFDGKGIIARKYLDRRATREYLKELKYLSTRESHESRIKSNNEFDLKYLEKKKNAEQKKASGEKLSAEEERSLSYTKQPVLTFEDYIKRYQKKDLFEKLGTNSEAYLKYYDSNKDYFYAEDAMYVISVDEDVKSLGIPYYDKRLLHTCITMLEKGKDTEKAQRILDRYTMLDFTTPAAWRKWFENNKEKIFFTETGGYKFMVNTYDKKIEGNNYHKKKVNP